MCVSFTVGNIVLILATTASVSCEVDVEPVENDVSCTAIRDS